MQFYEVLSRLDELPDETFICARRPWHSESEILLVPYPPDLRIPADVVAQGFEYLLEVSTAKEILEEFLMHKPSPQQVADFVLYYAENDAFPEWANLRCRH